MIDLNKQLKILVKTGNVDFGSKRSLEAAKAGRAKLILLASNCPAEARGQILENARISGVRVFSFPGTSIDLGIACDRLHAVAALTVREPGDSEILKAAESI